MRRRGVLLLLVLLLVGGCADLRISRDYNPDFDFSTIRRIALLYPKSDDGIVTLTQQRFARALEKALRRKGFLITDKARANAYAVFHLNVTEKRQVVTDYQMIGLYPYRPFYYGYGVAVPVEREYTWKEGRFIVDIVIPDGNKIVWRGIAEDRLHTFKTPQARTAYIQKVVDALLASFPPKTDQGAKP